MLAALAPGSDIPLSLLNYCQRVNLLAHWSTGCTALYSINLFITQRCLIVAGWYRWRVSWGLERCKIDFHSNGGFCQVLYSQDARRPVVWGTSRPILALINYYSCSFKVEDGQGRSIKRSNRILYITCQVLVCINTTTWYWYILIYTWYLIGFLLYRKDMLRAHVGVLEQEKKTGTRQLKKISINGRIE